MRLVWSECWLILVCLESLLLVALAFEIITTTTSPIPYSNTSVTAGCLSLRMWWPLRVRVRVVLLLSCRMRGHVCWKVVVREVMLRRKKVEKNWKVGIVNSWPVLSVSPSPISSQCPPRSRRESVGSATTSLTALVCCAVLPSPPSRC